MNTQDILPRLMQSDTAESKSFAAQLEQTTTSTISVTSDADVDSTKSCMQLLITSENTIFQQNGYRKIKKICDTSQGELIKAYQFSNNQYVAIKKTNRLLFNECISIQDETTFCVSENIIKEALILQYLTVDNKCVGNYIVTFKNFFQSDTDYYLVIEYVESEMNLKQFVSIAHKYLKQGKLQLKEYQKTIKYLFWQLCVTLFWLHDSMQCCHLDLCLENIMVANCQFLQLKNGCYKIDPQIAIRLVDFGVSEVFHHSFKCNKQGLSLDNESYAAPRVYADDIYHAPAADMWSVGMMLWECITGKPLYTPMDIFQCNSWASSNIPLLTNGYWSLHNNKLKTFIALKNINSFTNDTFDVLTNLLNINQNKRLNAMGILKHQWFSNYYNIYRMQIEKKALIQKKRLEKQKNKLRNFPFYIMMQIS
eukprot:150207_1